MMIGSYMKLFRISMVRTNLHKINGKIGKKRKKKQRGGFSPRCLWVLWIDIRVYFISRYVTLSMSL